MTSDVLTPAAVRQQSLRRWRSSPLNVLLYGVLPWAAGSMVSIELFNAGVPYPEAPLGIAVMVSCFLLARCLDRERIARRDAAMALKDRAFRYLVLPVSMAVSICLFAHLLNNAPASSGHIIFPTVVVAYGFLGFWVPLLFSAYALRFLALMIGRSQAFISDNANALTQSWNECLRTREYTIIYGALLVAFCVNPFLPGVIVLVAAALNVWLLGLCVAVIHAVEDGDLPKQAV